MRERRTSIRVAPATRQYALNGIFHERVSLTLPFEIDIDLTEIDRI